MAKVTVIRKQPTKENLIKLYDVLNEIFKDESCFYTSKQVEELKKDESNIFIS